MNCETVCDCRGVGLGLGWVGLAVPRLRMVAGDMTAGWGRRRGLTVAKPQSGLLLYCTVVTAGGGAWGLA